MSEKMYPIPFKSLMNWVVTEYAREGEIFGVHTPYYASGKTLPIFGETIETPFGPAAGPNSQLAQNIIAAYFAGARFFEVKTVQKMDGEELARCIPRPCILPRTRPITRNGQPNSRSRRRRTSISRHGAHSRSLSKIYGLGSPDGFVFNMSVGYDLDGIKGPKIDSYINNMMDASGTAQFQECLAVLTECSRRRRTISPVSPRVSAAASPFPPSTAVLRRRSSALPPTCCGRSTCTRSSSAIQPSLATRPPAPSSIPWAMTTSSSTSIISTRTCSGLMPCRCSSGCRRWPTPRAWSSASSSPIPSRSTPRGTSCPAPRCTCPAGASSR